MRNTARNLRWLCAEGGSLEVTFTHQEYGEIPYVINNGGSTPDEIFVWNSALAGELGEIAPVPTMCEGRKEELRAEKVYHLRREILLLREDELILGLDNSEKISALRTELKELT